jgi:hypothetical protein
MENAGPAHDGVVDIEKTGTDDFGWRMVRRW